MRRLRRLICEYTNVTSNKKLSGDATKLLDFLRRCNAKSGRKRFDSQQLAEFFGAMREQEIRRRFFELESRGLGQIVRSDYSCVFELTA